MTGSGSSGSRPNGSGNGHSSGAFGAGLGSRVPAPVSTFVGRDAERAELADLLGAARLVTVCGPPGIGKTRLAAEVASAEAAGFADGVTWVDLAAFSDSDAVVGALALALGVHEQARRPLIDAVVGALQDRSALVVLDNCEHLVDAASAAARAVLEGCPHVKVLATSRQPLDIVGECRFDVTPLPDADGAELFCARARAVYPVFDVDPDAAQSVDEICHRLDGVPLAIELAAGRVGVPSVAQIAARLDDRFALLAGAQRPFWGRHQTLEALSWSYDLLEEHERTMLRRLGTFGGDFTLGAVEGVCGGGEIGDEQVLDLLASLVSKSLVVARTTVDPARYRLLETIRAYAAEWLAKTEEAAAVTARHAEWYLGLVETAEPHLTAGDQLEWLGRLDADYVNVRTALVWALDHDGNDALRLASALSIYWRLRGQFSVGANVLTRALDQSLGASPALRAKGLWGAGFLTQMTGDEASAESLLGQSLTIYGQLGDRRGQARCHLLIGNCRLYDQGLEAGIQVLDRSVGLAQEAGDSWCLSHALALYGWAQLGKGDVTTAWSSLEEALAVARKANDAQGLRIALTLLGNTATAEGDRQRAAVLFEEAVAISRRLGDSYGASIALGNLGSGASYLGDDERARRALEEQLAVERSTGSPESIGRCLSALGHLYLRQGHRDDAQRVFGEAAALVGFHDAGRCEVLLGLGNLALQEASLALARIQLNEALALAESSGRPRLVSRALRSLGVLATLEGHPDEAESRYSQVLERSDETGDLSGIVTSLEALGGLAARTRDPDRAERTVRLLAAAQAARLRAGYGRLPDHERNYSTAVATARTTLTEEAFEEAWTRGGELTTSQAVAYALGSRGRRDKRPPSGWPSLTRAEREVARLVGEGLTNPQIAERRFISPHTVKRHLASVFIKLGVTSRLELSNEVRLRDR